nr:DUF2218 domain-containing protein [Polymorphobacter sp.]
MSGRLAESPVEGAIATRACVPTTHASRYLQQLCKHWAHKFAVTFDSDEGSVAFPGGTVLWMAAEDDVLLVCVMAADAQAAVTMQGVVAQHLDRFAFREAPLAFDWSVPG